MSDNLAPLPATVVSDLPVTQGASRVIPTAPFSGHQTIPLAITLTPRNYSFRFDPSSNKELQGLLRLFESCTIDSLEIHSILEPGLGLAFEVGVTANTVAEGGDLVASPLYYRVGGAQYGPVERVWHLPSPTAFSREIKAPTTGNSPPCFHFRLSGFTDKESKDLTVRIRISMAVTFRGVGVLPATILF